MIHPTVCVVTSVGRRLPGAGRGQRSQVPGEEEAPDLGPEGKAGPAGRAGQEFQLKGPREERPRGQQAIPSPDTEATGCG